METYTNIERKQLNVSVVQSIEISKLRIKDLFKRNSILGSYLIIQIAFKNANITIEIDFNLYLVMDLLLHEHIVISVKIL